VIYLVNKLSLSRNLRQDGFKLSSKVFYHLTTPVELF